MNPFYKMKHAAIMMVALCLLSLCGQSQNFENYQFEQSIVPYDPLVGATILVPDIAIDDMVLPITFPFEFYFNGQQYTNGYLNSNGFITLGNVVPGNGFATPIASTVPYNGVIAAWANDIRSLINAPLPSTIQQGTLGTAPNRIVVFQWENFHPWGGGQDYEISFQIRLFEGNGRIEMSYKTDSQVLEDSFVKGAQVGLRGSNNTQFMHRKNTTGTSWNASTAATLNTQFMFFRSTGTIPGMPANGLRFTWGIFGCMTETACNYDPLASIDDGTCCYSQCGCTDPVACNFDAAANCMNLGTCLYLGCTDTLACNFWEGAGCDDGSCEYISACMDVSACNFNPAAGCDDGSCVYPGCTDVEACNYEPEAACDDGSCSNVLGCMNPNACNYDPLAICSDGSCTFEGCTNPLACNYDQWAGCDDGSCYGLSGCDDETACNYDPLAECNDGSCINAGCTNPLACNYNEFAGCDNGTCSFISGCNNEFAANYTPLSCGDVTCLFRVNGFVYYDQNENAFYDNSELGLASQTLTISGYVNGAWLNLIVSTSNNGNYSFFDIPAGFYTITHAANALFPFHTTPNPVSLMVGFTNGIPTAPHIGVSDTGAPVIINFSGDYSPAVPGYPCDVWHTHSFCTWLSGNASIHHATVDVEFSPLILGLEIPLSGTVYQSDSIVGNHMYFSTPPLVALAPNSMLWFQVSVHTPNWEHIDEWVTNYVHVYGYDEFDNLVAQGYKEITVLVTCAYDPNAISTEPRGYEEPNYILPNQNIEYTVQFQNTGNAPATNVIVRDTIDTGLNLSTFSMGVSMHNCFMQLNPATREAVFYFENIMLPDSATNEPGSHGIFTYFIKPNTNIAPNTVIDGTAHIYFDNNPPIVTNTTFNTIFDCNSFTGITSETIVCQGDELIMNATQNNVEDYEWKLNGLWVSDESTFDASQLDPGTYTVSVKVSNPLCLATKYKTITILETPTIDAGTDIIICTGESTVLNATGAENLVWSNAQTNGATYLPLQTETIFASATNALGCSSMDDLTITVNVMPMLTMGEAITLCSGESFVLSATSTDAITWSNGHTNGTSYEPLQNETLIATATNVFDCVTSENLNITVEPTNVINAGADISICEGETITLYAEGNGEIIWSNGIENGATFIPTSTILLTAMPGLSNACSTADQMLITVNEMPNVSAGADISICFGDYILLNATGANNLTWSNNITNGTSYQPLQSETITATGGIGNCSDTDQLNITVNQIPGIDISETGTIMTAPQGASWQWYFNGEVIVGATNETYSATEAGYYFVETTNAEGCTQESEVVFVISVSEFGNASAVLYPNPMSENAQLELHGFAGTYEANLYNSNAQLVRNYSNQTSHKLNIEKGSLAADTYFLNITQNGKLVITLKLEVK